MRFIEFLIEGNMVRSNSAASKAGTPSSDVFAKHQIRNLNAAAKDARNNVKQVANHFRTKNIDDNKFGDPDLVALSRKHEIDSKIPLDFIRQEMKSTQPKVKRERKKISRASNKVRNKNGGKM